jgi:hypothetical protein
VIILRPPINHGAVVTGIFLEKLLRRVERGPGINLIAVVHQLGQPGSWAEP